MTPSSGSPHSSPVGPVRRVSFSTRTPRKAAIKPILHRSPYVFPESDSENNNDESDLSDDGAYLSGFVHSDEENLSRSKAAIPPSRTPSKRSIPRIDFSAKKPVLSALLPTRQIQPAPVRDPESPTFQSSSTVKTLLPSITTSGKVDELAEVDLALDLGALGLDDTVESLETHPLPIEVPVISSEEESDGPVIPRRQRARRLILSDNEEISRPGPSNTRRIIISSDESDSPSSPSRNKSRARRTLNCSDTSDSPQQIIDLTAGSEDESEYDSMQDFIVEDSDESYILTYTPPPKPFSLPNFQDLSLSDDEESSPPSPKKALAKTPKKRKEWEVERAEIAQRLFDELDRKVFEGKLGIGGAGATIEWSKRLLTTAGTANLAKARKSDGTSTRTAKITLSIKVLTEEDQIINTVAHEMCHLATWLISDEMKNPHGRVFKSWGRKIMRKRPDITVTTKHDYEIVYKFEWKCTNETCGKIYRRHSKSIDIKKHSCGSCRSKLEPLFATKESTPFQVYLKQNMAHAKAALPNASHGDVMRALSKRWAEGGTDHEGYWRSLRHAS